MAIIQKIVLSLHPKTTLEGNVSFIWGGFQTY